MDSDPAVSRAIVPDLRGRYGVDDRIMRAPSSGVEALTMLGELMRRGRFVALVVSDQWMPQMTASR